MRSNSRPLGCSDLYSLREWWETNKQESAKAIHYFEAPFYLYKHRAHRESELFFQCVCTAKSSSLPIHPQADGRKERIDLDFESSGFLYVNSMFMAGPVFFPSPVNIARV